MSLEGITGLTPFGGFKSFEAPETPRIPEVRNPPPVQQRPRAPRRDSERAQRAGAEEAALFRRRGRRTTLLTAGQGAGAPRETGTRDTLGQTGR